MKYFPSPFGDLIIWGRQSVYYLLTGGQYTTAVKIIVIIYTHSTRRSIMLTFSVDGR